MPSSFSPIQQSIATGELSSMAPMVAGLVECSMR